MPGADLLEVVDALYAAALEPERWQEALAALSRSVGAIGATIVPLGPGDTMRSVSSASIDEANAAYQDGWWREDPARAGLVRNGARPGTVCSDRSLVGADEMRRHPFYQDFLRSFGISESLAVITAPAPGQRLSVSAQGALRKGFFGQAEMDVMVALAPHIGRAFAITSRLIEARYLRSELADALERLAWGVVLLDGAGQVRCANATAEALTGGPLTIRQKHLEAARRQDDARLKAAIRAARPGSGLVPAGGVLIHDADGRAVLQVDVVPMRARLDVLELLTLGQGAVMLLIRRLDSGERSITEHLRAAGLSPAEARLAAALGNGEALRAVADQSSISYETARSHLRSIFAKLGLRRQSELVALVTRLAALIPG